MTREEIIARHKELHRSLDELLACFIAQTGRGLHSTSLMGFIGWAHAMTLNPTCSHNSEATNG